MKPIGIVMATKMEAEPVIRALGLKPSGQGLYRGDKPAVFLAVSGVGRECARSAAYRLCDAGAKQLLSAGLCGALVPEAKIGDVITDRIATVDVPVTLPAERQRLALKAGARAVDMETQAVIEAGTRRGVPIRVLRVVGDAFEDDISPLLGSGQPFSYWRIALRLLNPRAWGLARRLHRQSQIANAKLQQVVIAYLENNG